MMDFLAKPSQVFLMVRYSCVWTCAGLIWFSLLAGYGKADEWREKYDAAMSNQDWPTAIAAAEEMARENQTALSGQLFLGIAKFYSGDIEGSVAEFNIVNDQWPEYSPNNWQRGIALYYAEKYQEGVEQFELHHEVNGNDVENSVWHYICNRHVVDREVARKQLIGSNGDSRYPMMQILRMYREEIEPEELLVEVELRIGFTDESVEAPLSLDEIRKRLSQRRLFPSDQFALLFAYLYVGLWYEINGDVADAKDAIAKANLIPIDTYMSRVARIHAAQREWESLD